MPTMETRESQDSSDRTNSTKASLKRMVIVADNDTEMSDEMITLNAGGVLYFTTLATLRSNPDSMLGSMFSGRHEIVSLKDPNGHVFLDCNGQMFKYILDYIRRKKLCLPESFDELELLKAEADFFQIEDMVTAIDQKIAERNPPKVEIDLSPCHLLEMVDFEKVEDYEGYINSHSGYTGRPIACVHDYPNLYDANGGVPRGISLRGETEVLLSLKPSDHIQREIYHDFQLENDHSLPSHFMANLYGSSELKNDLILYLLQNKWQLVSSSFATDAEKQLSISKYLWSMPKSECVLNHKWLEGTPAQPMQEAEEAEEAEQPQ